MRSLVGYDRWLFDRVRGVTLYDRIWAMLRAYNGGLGHWQKEASLAANLTRPAVDAQCGRASRATVHCAENLGYLSPISLAEHLDKHPEIGLEDYQKIPDILDRGAVYKQGEDRLVVLQLDGVLYRAGLKRTKSGLKNYFLTLYKTNEKAAERSVISKAERLR